MKKILKSKLIYAVFIFFIIVGILKIIYQDVKIFLNITPSVKIGIYITRKYENQFPLKKGTYVIFHKPKKATKNREFYQDFLKIK